MAIVKRKTPLNKTQESFEKANEIKKLSLYVTVVNQGQGDAVASLFQKAGSSMQYIQMGNGTATKDVLDILGIEENRKEIVFCLIKKELVPDARNELEAFFAAHKKNRGIGFSVDLTSLIGVRIYKFLTQTI